MSATANAPPPPDASRRAAAERALETLVETGDLDRVVELARVLGGATDAMSDDIVGRLAGTAADGLDLLDRVNRSGVARALPAIAALVENGDLDRLVGLARIVGGATDAMSDEIVGRLAGTAADGLDLLDRVNRSGVARALPAIAALVENGDLDRLVALARIVGGATDAMSDEIVGRLAGTAADGLDLLDRVNRSGVARALPAIAALVENGDLDRLVALARITGGAADALSDEIVSRLAETATNALVLIDQVTRTGLADRLVALADQADRSNLFADLLGALDRAAEETRGRPAPAGGIGGLWQLLKQPETQAAMQYAFTVLRQFRSAREGRGAQG